MRSPDSPRRPARRAYQLKVTLLDTDPEIWRRLLVPADIKLGKLNEVIQEAMGWSGSHLHEFVVGPVVYSDLAFELEHYHEDQSGVRLADIAPHIPSAFIHKYDFADGWNHLVVVEEYRTRGERDPDLPICVEGARACPPEDVGGTPGYEQFVIAVRDSAHEEHVSMLAWVGGAFDPEAFDVAAANARLRRLRARPSRSR
jgi:hypothetical protein